MSHRTCIETGCPNKHLAKGYCRNHYRSHGLDASRDQRRLRTGTCSTCGAVFQRLGTGNRLTVCSETCRRIRIAEARRKTWPSTTIHPTRCQHCEQAFIARRGGCSYCSTHCAREAAATRAGNRGKTCKGCDGQAQQGKTLCAACRMQRTRETRRASRHSRRARLHEAQHETIHPSDVYERDQWICGICRLVVDPTLTYPDPGYPSLDHVIPLAKGGSHTMGNVQLAHLKCNMIKRDQMPTQLLYA